MIGTKLRKIRKQRNLSLRELARLTGLSHSFICDIENEHCNPSIENLKILADALETKPGFFLNTEVAANDLTESKTG